MPEPQIVKLEQPLKGCITATPLDDQPQGSVFDSINVLPRDCKTGRACLSTRPGYATLSTGPTAGLFLLGAAYNEPGAVQLMGASASALYRFTSGSFSSVGSITASSSRTIHAASYGKWLFVACNAPYKFYDYDADNNGTPDHTIASWTATTAGTIPPNCRIVSTHMGRIVLLADPANANVVNFSASDDPFDWDFSDETSGAAISIPIGEAATAGFPHTNDCFIVGTKSGMWIIQGNPAASGSIVRQFEFTVGPINSSAWCKGDSGYTYVLTHNGLYRIAGGCGTPAEPVSRNLIPDALIGLDGTNSKAYLVYNERFRFVEIHIMGTNAASWCYDVDGGGFWEITAPGTGILAAFRFGPADSATASGALVATDSGVMRFDNTAGIGGGTDAFASIMLNMAPHGQKALIQKGVAAFSDNTDDTSATVEIFGGESATAAATQAADRKSTVTIGQLLANHGTWFPRVGGKAAALTITQGSTSNYWSLEGLSLYTLSNGTERG